MSDIKRLFEASDIPADKQEEFTSIFEAAVSVKAKALTEEKETELKEAFDAKELELKEKMEQYTDYLREEYANNIDEYMDYAVSSFMEENKLAITNGVKAKQFDSIIEGLSTVMAEHNIDLADDKVDVVAELEESLSETESELNAVKKELIKLRSSLNEKDKADQVAKATSTLAESEKETVAKLAEELEYDDSFSSKLKLVVESVSGKKVVSSVDDEVDPQYISEDKKEEESNTKPKRKMLTVGTQTGFFG